MQRHNPVINQHTNKRLSGHRRRITFHLLNIRPATERDNPGGRQALVLRGALDGRVREQLRAVEEPQRREYGHHSGIVAEVCVQGQAKREGLRVGVQRVVDGGGVDHGLIGEAGY
ncbi:predicted protein [Histoplasma capsulatum var. duboisii H88]|uniref:Predicted protein n=1 Tax=Ajellomyces capsulatus (strain H88) TaxID=544711 RepID=F0U4T8_AJEC8|nr:predicted protein [Histoplasma capsulatum var. duboisii H88]